MHTFRVVVLVVVLVLCQLSAACGTEANQNEQKTNDITETKQQKHAVNKHTDTTHTSSVQRVFCRLRVHGCLLVRVVFGLARVVVRFVCCFLERLASHN